MKSANIHKYVRTYIDGVKLGTFESYPLKKCQNVANKIFSITQLVLDNVWNHQGHLNKNRTKRNYFTVSLEILILMYIVLFENYKNSKKAKKSKCKQVSSHFME